MAISLLILALAAPEVLADDPRPADITLSGSLLTGPKGTPLYVTDEAKLDGGPPCTDACLQAWPAFEASPDEQAIGDWAPVGGQWTYKGRYIYYFSSDADASKAKGDGVGKWRAIHNAGSPPKIATPPEASVGKVDTRFVLTDYRGHVLYSFIRDGKTAACKAECLEIWPPLLASALAQPVGEWTPVDRPDGIRQWSWRGRLLYTFSEDVAPADSKGADVGGVWKLVNVTARDGVLASVSDSGANKPDRR